MPTSAESASPAPLVLGYGHAPTRVRRWGRRLFLLAWLAGFLWLAYDKWGIQVRLQGSIIYRQHQCLTHVEPSDRVVIDVDPIRAGVLASQPQYRLSKPSPNRFGGMPNPKAVAAMYQGMQEVWEKYRAGREMWDEYELLRNPPPPIEIPDFSGAPEGYYLGGPESDDSTTVFVHERRGPGGRPRLIRLIGYWYGENDGVSFRVEVFERTYLGLGKEMPSGIIVGGARSILPIRAPDGTPTLRLYAGQADPADESRFIIRYETSTGGGTIEGRIGADDNITMRVLDGPLMPASSKPRDNFCSVTPGSRPASLLPAPPPPVPTAPPPTGPPPPATP